jgi:hypothetical protein
MGAMADPIIDGNLAGPAGTFGWACGMDAFPSLFAGSELDSRKGRNSLKRKGISIKY